MERRPGRLRQLGYVLLAGELGVGLVLVGVGWSTERPALFFLGVLLVALVLIARALLVLLE